MERKQKKQYIIMGVFMIIMAVFFTACEEETEEISESLKSEYIYQPTYQSITTKIDYIESAVMKEDRIYMYGTKWEEEDEGKTYYYIASCNIDGSDLQETELKGLRKREYVRKFCMDDQNRLILATQESEYKKETNEEKEYCRIHIINEKGNIEKTIELKKDKENAEDYFYIDVNTIAFFNGFIYVSMENKIYCFNEKGSLKETYEVDGEGYIECLIPSAEGKLYIYVWMGENGKYVIKEFDPKKGTFGKAVDFGEYSMYLSIRSGEGNKVFTNDGNNIYEIDLSSGKVKTKLNWINSDIDGDNIREYFPLEDEKILAISTFYDESKKKNKTELVTLNRIKASELKKKKTLIYASAAMDLSVKAKILDFNKTNENYRIEVRDYSGYEDSETKLNLDIVSGKIPDILDIAYGISGDLLAKKGLFLDLYPLIEQDKEIKKEDFIPSVLNAMEIEEKLYFLPYNFSIIGLLSGKKIVGDIEGWTMEEMMELYEAMPEGSVFMEYMSREAFLSIMIRSQLGEYIDWSTGEVKFNTDSFLKLMEFSKNFPSEENEDIYSDLGDPEILIKNGKLFLDQLNLYDPMEIIYYGKGYKKQGGYRIVSYPSNDKNNKLAINGLGSMHAITKQCKEKEDAWEFIREFFTYEYEKDIVSYAFPVRQDVLDEKLEYAQATEAYTDDDGNKVEPMFSVYDYERALSKEEADMIYTIISRIGSYRSYNVTNNAIYEIINEELQAFYAEDKTAKEAAEVIQSRVKIYVSENS